MARRSYLASLSVNCRKITEVIIDSHYEAKHKASVSDQVILNLVRLLDGKNFERDTESAEFEYFTTEGLELSGKSYRLVWLLSRDKFYIGVVNAYRRRSK